jgi:hypothetical protein
MVLRTKRNKEKYLVESYKGCDAIEVIAFLETFKVLHRVVRVDDIEYSVHDDVCMDRVNLEIEEGLISNIYFG